ncbi:hypothetical protein GN244_ATG07538 [Phytophthora infestans]|uniref:DUF7726 domain-containing protein n=1 Tax=Phytophthora infestans TaxID=4787 RepID=A0A833SXP5_PHYIN|nr:hypothetical protein GN244_ATG07538 [Phytophthora infestans]KAF4134364.1 hypothetical protein GN958_ATG16496 [Phytophthora infestans]KAI9980591.1 hypothetical protein PInf_009893 [Phytophthora infestans]
MSGPAKGAGNTTLHGASLFFYRREKRAKIEKTTQNSKDKKRKAAEQREEKAKKKKDGLDLLERIEEIELEDENVPVYDDCDDIRQKISEFLGEKIVTQAAFLTALGVSANNLHYFMGIRRGARSGAETVVYRKAYTFFEKKRIIEGGAKTKKRLENEERTGPKGFKADPRPTRRLPW